MQISILPRGIHFSRFFRRRSWSWKKTTLIILINIIIIGVGGYFLKQAIDSRAAGNAPVAY